MKNIQMDWHTSSVIKKQHSKYPITQVYCWLITDDNQVVIVSKDGLNWQLPGGKPKSLSEDIFSVAIREVLEETGFNTKSSTNNIEFFGYYTVDEGLKKLYIQVRTYLFVGYKANELKLKPKEDEFQEETEKIKFVKTVTHSEMLKLIPWMKNSGEYKTLISNGII